MASKTEAPAPASTHTDDDAALRALGMVPGPIDYLEQPEPTRTIGKQPEDRRARADAEPNREGRVDYELNDEDRKRISDAVAKNVGAKPNPDWPRVIAMKLGRPDKNVCSLFSWAGAGCDRIDFTPFQRSAPLHPAIVESITRPKKSRPYGFYWQHFWKTPPMRMVDSRGVENLDGPVGDCRNEMHFDDPISGQRIETCIYGGCKHHPMPGHLAHSVWQAQSFVSKLKTDAAIRNYIRMHDPRPQVGHFATLVIDQRSRQALAAAGMTSVANENIVF